MDTLTMNTMAWYNNLLDNTINSWEEIKKAFLARYIHNANKEIDIWYASCETKIWQNIEEIFWPIENYPQ